MTAFSDLPFEVRLLIWDVLLQPRVVCINIRPWPEDPDTLAFNDDNYEPDYEVLCPTPVPLLLHICSESRTLALAHYELTFGHVRCPRLVLPGVFDHGFSILGVPYVSPIKGNAAEVEKLSPKIYFNFKHDTVVFGHLLPLSPCRQHAVNSDESRAYWPFREQFDMEMLHKLESLSLCLNVMREALFYLDQQVGLQRFQRLRNLYFHLDPATYDHNTHLSRKLELVDLSQNPMADEERERIAQRFVDRYREKAQNRDTVINAEGTEGVKMICKESLNNRRHKDLRDFLLRDGSSPEDVLKCVLLRRLTTS
jgi:hypothetical protein